MNRVMIIPETASRQIERPSRANPRSVRCIAVTSGKGGVGKSNISLNLAIYYAKLGRRTLLIDADSNLANLDVLLGINSKYSLTDVALGRRSISEIIITGPHGLKILPAGSGVSEIVGSENSVRASLAQGLIQLEEEQDIIILDTGAGISDGVVEIAAKTGEVVVVTTPEPTAITDAYAAIKVISARNLLTQFHLLVNLAKNRNEAEEAARKIRLVVENYLTVSLDYLGFIPVDESIPQAVTQQIPFLLCQPRGPAALHLILIARRLLKLPGFENSTGLFL